MDTGLGKECDDVAASCTLIIDIISVKKEFNMKMITHLPTSFSTAAACIKIPKISQQWPPQTKI